MLIPADFDIALILPCSLMITISVVIPTCDRPDYLVEAVDCVLSQSTPPDEVIVVNNGSHPLEEGLLPPEVRVQELPPRVGAAEASNQGVASASGDFVAFLDDDDLWEPDYVRKVIAQIDETGPDCLITRKDALSDGRIVPYKNADGKLDLGTLFVSNPGVGGQNTIVRRQAFLAIGGYDTHLIAGYDKALIIDLLTNGYVVAAAPMIQAILRQHGGSRLTDAESMHRGISSFVSKYGMLMSPAQMNFNRLKVHYYRYLDQRHTADYLQYWRCRLLNSLLRVTDSRIPKAPKLPRPLPRTSLPGNMPAGRDRDND